MAAVIAATTHAPFMAATLAFELSGDYSLVIPLIAGTSIAALVSADVPEGAWLIASQSIATSLGGRDVFRTLPRAEGVIAAATSRPSALGGTLGKAYDELAEIIAIDTT